jgi:hypothetical protein
MPMSASPEQHSIILRSSLAVAGKLISPTITREKLTATEIAKKKCLVIIAKNLNKGLNPEQVEKELKTLIGEKNIVSVYFPMVEVGMHAGIANIEIINAPIYKKFVKKTHKLQGKYVKFNPHPRSLDGSAAPSEETLKEFGFHDLNMALANRVEAVENATPAAKRPGAKETLRPCSKMQLPKVTKPSNMNSKLI